MGLGITLAGQISGFLLACLCGAGLGALYDIFRILRIAFPFGRLAVFAQDALYWVLCGAISFFFILEVNGGEIRGYLLAGELAGATLYFFTVGAILMRCAHALIEGIKRLIRVIFRRILHPISRPVVKISRFLQKKSRQSGKVAKKAMKSAKIHLKHDRVLLYNLIKHRVRHQEKYAASRTDTERER